MQSQTPYSNSETRRVTWVSPDMETKNQIDYISVQQNMKRFIKNCRSCNSADIGSDHSLVVNIEIKAIKSHRPKAVRKGYKVNKAVD